MAKRKRSPAPPDGGRVWIWGLHAVRAALANPARARHRLVATADAAAALAGLAPFEVVPRQELDRRLPPGAAHQGAAGLFGPLPVPPLADVLEKAVAGPAPLVVLDQVTDPQNVGAILRAAAAFGAVGVVVQDRHSPPASGALLKAASGGAEHVPLVRVVNVARTLDAVKAAGIRCLGLDAAGGTALAAAVPDCGTAFVLGAEGRGLRRLTRERCDVLVRVPIRSAVASLNVATAAAIALYEYRRHA